MHEDVILNHIFEVLLRHQLERSIFQWCLDNVTRYQHFLKQQDFLFKYFLINFDKNHATIKILYSQFDINFL